MLDIILSFFTADYVFTVIRVMTPILFAGLSCMVFLKGGIDPIGIEGIMLLAAMCGSVGSYYTDSALGGVFIAILSGILISFLFGYATLQLKSVEILAGIAINTLAAGLTIFVIYFVAGEKGSTQSLAGPVVGNINLPIIEKIPILGEMISGHNVLTYFSIILMFVLSYMFKRTPLGLRIRSVGENSVAAESVGINVMKYKYITLVIAGTLAGLGGAFMSMGYVSFFSKNMIAGRGWIGMAAEAMGRGNPFGIFASSLIFGIADSLAIRLQLFDLPSQLVNTIPYVITIITISIYSYKDMKSKKRR
ncbi:MAG: ABC transporter permease [Sphaerochaeta sp.]|jgi:simple sugar transport system permease protein